MSGAPGRERSRHQADSREELGQRLTQLDARQPGSAAFTARQGAPAADDSTDALAVIDGVLAGEETHRTRFRGFRTEYSDD